MKDRNKLKLKDLKKGELVKLLTNLIAQDKFIMDNVLREMKVNYFFFGRDKQNMEILRIFKMNCRSKVKLFDDIIKEDSSD